MSKKISFIGLGAMGGPMATNIIKKELNYLFMILTKIKKIKLLKRVELPLKIF